MLWEVDGERQQFELQEFHAHPETPSLREVENVTEDGCPDSANCCECLDCIGCTGLCGNCDCLRDCKCCDQCTVC